MIKTTGMTTILDNPFEEISEKLNEVLRTLGDMYQHNVPPTHELTSMSDVENGEVTLTLSLRKDLKEKLYELSDGENLNTLIIEAVEHFIESKVESEPVIEAVPDIVWHTGDRVLKNPKQTEESDGERRARLLKMYNAFLSSTKITNDSIAKIVDIPTSTLCNWKLGNGRLTSDRLDRLERFIETEHSSFYNNYNSFCKFYNINQHGGEQ